MGLRRAPTLSSRPAPPLPPHGPSPYHAAREVNVMLNDCIKEAALRRKKNPLPIQCAENLLKKNLTGTQIFLFTLH